MVTYDEKRLLELTFAEFEGVGTWYEYLAKYKLFKGLKDVESLLLAGLPQEYGIAADILLFAVHGCRIVVIDDRKHKLQEFMDLARKFKVESNVEGILCKDLTKFPFEDNRFDLVTNTEVIQRVENYGEMIKEMERVSREHVFLFIPNAYYYSHYLITKIKSFKLDKMVKMCNLKLFGKGYLDMPPWPAGISVSAEGISFAGGSKSEERKDFEKRGVEESLFISSLKAVFLFLTPALIELEKFYFNPLNKVLSHMFFIHLVKFDERK